ncbi:uncharacterized protein Z518_08495 [Rhinocladiella mackenziei CBS 650.93]|uniref:Rhinocladiella mackenziei CBS 650.93 unplaced genomic scaffold supercont1.6, whole genome shotgun sequence n=1 Tax=Rhinocladiella mackenziei CBS 650.93 TaxID=1442369 RepID=A0A0D2I9M9_9EURO|nr:uncharacterized protein Z518_08495 [Rhinocladiella mackenziei CBS 650.93]KIX02554.1 hypothetical protein Z518_08495 [Rhinocladiella mackenziei CBS 650.93]
MMDRRSDLIRDSELDALFNTEFTVHTYREASASWGGRVVQRQEYWRRVSRIGRGAYGSVWLGKCVRGRQDIEWRAVKQVSTKPLSSGRRIDYSRELEAIAKFSHHKYVHRFVESFGWTSPLSEEAAGDVTYQILEGLSYMHDNQFAHRDLKPGNILIKSCPPQLWWVKIGDFGVSKRLENETAKSTLLKGTLGFIAPELHGFTPLGTPFAADMWSLGEISFQLITKEPVFKNTADFATYALQGQPFPSVDLLTHNVSAAGQNFMSSLMVPTPEKRLTAEQALKHQWMKQYLPPTIQPSPPSQEMTTISVRGQVKAQRKVTYHLGQVNGYTGLVRSVAFSPDGTTLASGSDDKSVRVWDSATGIQLEQFNSHTDVVRSVSFSPDGTTIASGSSDTSVRVWDAATGMQLRKLVGHTDSVMSVAFSPDSIVIASGSWDRSVRIWDAATGRPLRQLTGHIYSVRSVVFSPDGTTIVSSSGDWSVRIWDTATGRPLRQLVGHTDSVTSVAFSPDGTTIASSSDDRSVRVWDAATGVQLRQLDGHTYSVGSVVFSPDGTTIASGSFDKSVRIWDAATGWQLRQLVGHTDSVRSVAFSPDGTTIASGSFDKSVRIWDAATGRGNLTWKNPWM